jgi:hypothetical protein
MSTLTVTPELDDDRHISLCETLDRLLNTGVVVAGDAVISVADIELIYLNLRLMVTSVDTMRRNKCLPTPLIAPAKEATP